MAEILNKLFDVIDNNRITLVLTSFVTKIIDSPIIERYGKDAYIVATERTMSRGADQLYGAKRISTIRGMSPKTLIIIGSIITNKEEEYLRIILPSLINTKIIWLGCTYQKGYFKELYENPNTGKFLCRWDLMYEDFPDYAETIMFALSRYGGADTGFNEWRSRFNLEWI